MKELLTNEERLARQRARWAKQAEERRKPGSEFKALALVRGRAHQSKSGRRGPAGEKLISDAEMAIGWRHFWGKRGLHDMPAVSTAGVLR